MAYCMAMVLMSLKVFRMDGIGSLNFLRAVALMECVLQLWRLL